MPPCPPHNLLVHIIRVDLVVGTAHDASYLAFFRRLAADTHTSEVVTMMRSSISGLLLLAGHIIIDGLYITQVEFTVGCFWASRTNQPSHSVLRKKYQDASRMHPRTERKTLGRIEHPRPEDAGRGSSQRLVNHQRLALIYAHLSYYFV